MIIAILGSITAIAVLCWLLFTLAIYALPALGGVAAGIWAYQTGAGLPGSMNHHYLLNNLPESL